MKMDPNGKVLAVATGTGVEFFHFNGADPITPFTGVLGGTSGNITNMAWDEDGHLYAQNGKSGDLYIYVVGATTVKELSPVSIPYSSPNSSIIVRTK
jgi:outer membrane protein assembly factor BamB